MRQFLNHYSIIYTISYLHSNIYHTATILPPKGVSMTHPQTLCFKYLFKKFTPHPISTGGLRDILRNIFNLSSRICRSYSQTNASHTLKIGDIIAHICNTVYIKAVFGKPFIHDRTFVRRLDVYIFDA